MLIGRENELRELRAAWRCALAGRPQLAVVYGRRRVGKTFLCLSVLDEIRSAGHRAVYFNATEEAEAVQLQRLAEFLRRDLGDDGSLAVPAAPESWERALELLLALASSKPLAVVIDEVSFLAASTPEWASILQSVWDRATTLAEPAALLLVVTGSAVGTLVRVLGAGGPLFRRATVQRRLDPLGVGEAAQLLPGAAPEAVVEAYAACGGTPLYLQAWDPDASTDSNLRRLAGTPGGMLLEDAPSLLRDEIGAELGFARVLAAIGSGITRRGKIANAAGQRIEHPLHVLRRAGLVRRSLPLGAPRRADPIYEVADPYLRFWYSVLYRNVQLVEGGQGSAVLERERPAWNRHVAWVWEELARAHAVAEIGRSLPARVVIGAWWDRHGQNEIDVLGLDGDHVALAGEARWSDRPIDPHDLHQLREKARQTPHRVADVLLCVWSRKGVTPSAEGSGVLVFGPKDVVEARIGGAPVDVPGVPEPPPARQDALQRAVERLRSAADRVIAEIGMSEEELRALLDLQDRSR